VKILLIEDSETLRLSNQRALVEAGHDVSCADDCDSALQTARDQRPDLILLDLIVPKGKELEVLTRLKHSRATARIPVIALSALPGKKCHKLLDAGMEDYVDKRAIVSEGGMNRLPQLLERLIHRINRKRGHVLSSLLKK
jgi:putative two-component system response regulator